MATYTGVADANGDFNIPFSSSYTSGQKIVVTAEKDSATKSIELFAPSEAISAGAIGFSGTWDSFPLNIGIMTLKSEINSIGEKAFKAGSTSDKTIGGSITGVVLEAVQTIGMEAFMSCGSLLSVDFGPSIKTIGAYAFYSCTKLQSVSIPDTVTSIGENAFNYLPAANALNIGSGLTVINASAFQSWSNFTSELIIPNNITYIGPAAFSNWSKAKKLKLGSGLTSISSSAFANWTSCDEIEVLATTPPAAGSSFLSSLKSTCVIKVPTASLSAYQSAANWSAHASKMIGV